MAYQPPLNGGRINATIAGNTAGAGALISTGTLTLAGGNNITLSQAGNAMTISGRAFPTNTFGMSNLGNTSGTTGVISGSSGRLLFAGGNNVTLSQSLNGSSATISISAANQSIQTQGLQNVTLGGNTAGVAALVSSGTLTLAGGNNITLSQAGNAVTISGGAGGGGIALANSQTTFTSGTARLNASGAMTIGSAAGQSFNFSVPQTSSIVGVGGVSISTAGNTISISGVTGGTGGGGGIALANSQTTFTSGTANLVASGALTIASMTGQSFNLSVPQMSTLAGVGGVSLSTTGSTVNISGGDALMANLGGIRTRVNSSSWESRPSGYKMVFTIGADPSPGDMVDGDVRIVTP